MVCGGEFLTARRYSRYLPIAVFILRRAGLGYSSVTNYRTAICNEGAQSAHRSSRGGMSWLFGCRSGHWGNRESGTLVSLSRYLDGKSVAQVEESMTRTHTKRKRQENSMRIRKLAV